MALIESKKKEQEPPKEENVFKESDSKIGIAQISKLAERLDGLESKLRLLENKISLVEKKEESVEKNVISINNRSSARLDEINKAIRDFKDRLDDFNERFEQMIDEVRSKGSKAELDTIKKYLEYWKPIEFVTRGTAEKMIEDAIKREREG